MNPPIPREGVYYRTFGGSIVRIDAPNIGGAKLDYPWVATVIHSTAENVRTGHRLTYRNDGYYMHKGWVHIFNLVKEITP